MEDGKILRHRFTQHFEMCVAECLHLLRWKRSADPTAGPHPAVPCFPGEGKRRVQSFQLRQMDASFAPTRCEILQPSVVPVPMSIVPFCISVPPCSDSAYRLSWRISRPQKIRDV